MSTAGIITLSVANTSGLIAAGIVLLQLVIPSALTIILVRFLSEEHSAVTWSVVANQLQKSLWPLLMRSDVVAVSYTPRRIAFLAWLEPALMVTIGVAAIVTPLGLYDSMVLGDEVTPAAFYYIADQGPFSSTPARPGLGFSRMCVYACPGTTAPWNTSDLGENQFPDARIPKQLAELYQSGLSTQSSTVSSFFDIQYRQYSTSTTNNVNNRPSLRRETPITKVNVLEDDVMLIEGLIVDLKTGGIGFRNHTAPVDVLYGAEWEEDILFFVPVTSCVDLDVTMLQQEPEEYTGQDTANFPALYINDKGGMSGSVNAFPPALTKDLSYQEDPMLPARVQAVAKGYNYLNAMLLSVNKSSATPNAPRRYRIMSSLGLQEHDIGAYSSVILGEDMANLIGAPSYTINDDETSTLDDYLVVQSMQNATSFYLEQVMKYENPQRVNTENYTDSPGPLRACQPFDPTDSTDLNAIHVSCGVVLSPGRQTGAGNTAPGPDSMWERSMYACASATKAAIHTVRFGFNTSGVGLQQLEVKDIQAKTYDGEYPLWGLERPEPALEMNYYEPLYGLIDPARMATAVNLTAKRLPHLYLPASPWSFVGYPSDEAHTLNIELDFIPASGGASQVWASFYGNQPPDYSGATDATMSARWSNLTQDAAGTAHMMNMIWTDIAANAFVGTRGQLTHGVLPPNLVDTEAPVQSLVRRQNATNEPLPVGPAVTDGVWANDRSGVVNVYQYSPRVRFNWVYGIPAFIALLISAVIVITAIGFVVFGNTLTVLKYLLRRLSTGRVLASFLHPAETQQENGVFIDAIDANTKDWIKLAGEHNIVVSQLPKKDREVMSMSSGRSKTFYATDTEAAPSVSRSFTELALLRPRKTHSSLSSEERSDGDGTRSLNPFLKIKASRVLGSKSYVSAPTVPHTPLP